MQWLQSDHEANATLCEALAFIDAFDTSTSSSATGDYSSGVKKKRSHRDRVKSELQRLRNDASALEVTLTRLKQSLRRSIQESSSQSHQRRPVSLIDSTADADSTSNDPRVAAWMEVAMDEYRRRRQSEATNRQLKDLLAKQIELVRASEAALVFKLTEADINALYDSQMALVRHHGMGQEQQHLMASLGARVDQLQLDVDHLLERSELAVMDSVVSRSQRKVDEHTGIYFETTTCTPLLCSLELTARTLGNHFLGKAAKNKTVQNDLEGFQKLTYLEYQSETLELHVTATMRTCIQAHRVVYLWSSLTSLPSKRWAFVEDIMVFVRPTGSAQSLLQTWYRISVEEDDAWHSPDPLKEFIMRSLSNRVGDHLRRFKIDGKERGNRTESK